MKRFFALSAWMPARPVRRAQSDRLRMTPYQCITLELKLVLEVRIPIHTG